MSELDWREQSDPAKCLQALAAHRLLPVAGLLADRGLLRRDLVAPAGQLAAKSREEMRLRGEIEAGVMEAFVERRVPFLVLKGALLARTVYPAPEDRIRTDLDLLVPPDAVDAAQQALRAARFRPSYEVEGGPPMTQKQWIRPSDSLVHAVDLHWDLSNRPLLKQRLAVAHLLERAQSLTTAAVDARGLGTVDALLHAATHYYGHHRGEFRPDQWLLDMDLLWRKSDPPARNRAAERARACGVGSLLAAALQACIERFDTPVPADWLDSLRAASRGERAARLTQPVTTPVLDMLRNAAEETGWRARLRYGWRLAFPPAAHMRRKYPEGSRWGLPGLYVRRALGR
ncbi:nucleotidyltransferase family protein [Wenzhouxiangella sp. XN79A]|uniref:nucleotidyltransferase family protein n=1 Tax=Wenzhouxiangella sp. XN79A TaxID=2724193 RepID=UPI00144ABE03|nr:nucleotidyltransferase family protein [Wenzhouxiangella sp. XN79A]NKI33605.1 nucleotidyltransferase family protein [Wenzhouxiangella sp. XN79A]